MSDSTKRVRRAAQEKAVTQIQQVNLMQQIPHSAPFASAPAAASVPEPSKAAASTTASGMSTSSLATNGTSKAVAAPSMKRSSTPTNVPATAPIAPSQNSEDLTAEERLAIMRRNAPLLYDSILHHSLDWGSLSLCWGGLAEKRQVIDGSNYTDEHNTEQVLYVAGRTDGEYNAEARAWTGSPGELFVAQVAVAKPRTVHRNAVGKFQESKRSSRVAVTKRLIHPGEINRLRALPLAPNLVATQTDSPVVYVWNTQTQPHRTENMSSDDAKAAKSVSADGANPLAPSSGQTTASSSNGPSNRRSKTGVWVDVCKCSVPDFELIGHEQEPAQGALDTHGREWVLSGGEGVVLLWNLGDAAQGSNKIAPRARFKGHEKMVEDCSFRPASAVECCSVGQDRALMLWDARAASGPRLKVANIHTDDVNCCAWSPRDLILTGGSDCAVRVFDVRKLDKPISVVENKLSVMNVRWSPDDSSVFLASDDAGNLTLYRLFQPEGKCEVIFRHFGHRTSVQDVQFNPIDPWVLASVSDDSSDEARGGGGALQIWRVSEFVHRPLSDPLWASELEQALSKKTKTGDSSDEDSGGED